MRYRDFTLMLSEAAEVDGALALKLQVTEAAGLASVIEPVAARCELDRVRALASWSPSEPPAMTVQLDAGVALGRALLPGVIRQRLREALSLVRSRDEALRIRVIGSELAHCIPWEYAVLE